MFGCYNLTNCRLGWHPIRSLTKHGSERMHKLMVTAGVLFCFCDSAFAQAHHAAGSRFTAFACIVLGGISLNVYLFRLLQPVPRHDSLDRPARWVSKLEFAPAAFEGFSWWQLV